MRASASTGVEASANRPTAPEIEFRIVSLFYGLPRDSYRILKCSVCGRNLCNCAGSHTRNKVLYFTEPLSIRIYASWKMIT